MSTSVNPLPVWSERRPGSWDQCTEGAYLAVLAAAGFDRFPLGAFTAAERDAFDLAAEPDPPGGGSTLPLCDTASSRRYGRVLRSFDGRSPGGLSNALQEPGRLFVLQGKLSNLPLAHYLRRWQPSYTGGHAVAVLTTGDGRAWWADPLAPMLNMPDLVELADVVRFAYAPTYARTAHLHEHEVPTMLKPGAVNGVLTPCLAHLPEGKQTYANPDGTGGTALPYAYTATCIGVSLDGSMGAYALNRGGLRWFRLTDVRAVNMLFTVSDAVDALRRGVTP